MILVKYRVVTASDEGATCQFLYFLMELRWFSIFPFRHIKAPGTKSTLIEHIFCFRIVACVLVIPVNSRALKTGIYELLSG